MAPRWWVPGPGVGLSDTRRKERQGDHMATEGTKHLFVLSFPNETLAKVAVGELKDLRSTSSSP